MTSDNPPSTVNSLRAADAVRGLLITVIIGIVGYFAIIPPPASGKSTFSITHNGLSMLLIGAVLQLAIIFSRSLIARFERAQGMEGQLSPMVIHILQLLADGVTVLLFALAVFGGITQAESSI